MKTLFTFFLCALITCFAYAYDLGDDNSKKSAKKTHNIHVIDGQWQGNFFLLNELGQWQISGIDMEGQRVIDNCVVIHFMEYTEEDVLHTFSIQTLLDSDEDIEAWDLSNNFDNKTKLLSSIYKAGTPTETLEGYYIEANWMVVANNQVNYEVFQSSDWGNNWLLTGKASLLKKSH